MRARTHCCTLVPLTFNLQVHETRHQYGGGDVARLHIDLCSSLLFAFWQDPLNGPKEISFFCSSEASVNVAELDSSLQVVRKHSPAAAAFYDIRCSPVAIAWL